MPGLDVQPKTPTVRGAATRQHTANQGLELCGSPNKQALRPKLSFQKSNPSNITLILFLRYYPPKITCHSTSQLGKQTGLATIPDSLGNRKTRTTALQSAEAAFQAHEHSVSGN
ncbi:MAG: hypothetical protein KVP17_003460 [Porospora cf. gigantea B]|uniref:uncharacterized protein n=1 Tax=Porospora cf. gigantea B TaxID=2853592 RepID=UPI003571AA19|nr:MAG: hypothetical protein KVP17_003460 [Porospora cf. gigantea B]